MLHVCITHSYTIMLDVPRVVKWWIWVGIKWAGPLKPNSPFKPI